MKWVSDRNQCDICKADISAGKVAFFVDGMIRNSNSEWALMCPACHRIHGAGLGIGVGQKYNGDENAELIDGYSTEMQETLEEIDTEVIKTLDQVENVDSNNIRYEMIARGIPFELASVAAGIAEEYTAQAYRNGFNDGVETQQNKMSDTLIL